MSTCLVCTRPSQYASPYYRHAISTEYIQYATCRAPTAPGQAVCWNCGVSEANVSNSYQHDFMGWGKFTCIPIKRLDRCISCNEPKCVAAPGYNHAYVPEDLHDATCRPPRSVGNRHCWLCGIAESAVKSPE